MNHNFSKFLILTCFILLGFFVLLKPAHAVYTTTTNPRYSSGYDFTDVWGTFVTNERFWFDGQYYRFSFTPARDFYSSWAHYGDVITRIRPYSVYLRASYFFQNGGGGSSGAYFIENIHDLDGYETGDTIYFLWEKDRQYDTYIIEGDIAGSGIVEDNMFLNRHFKYSPDERLKPEYSLVQFGISYNDYVNLNHRYNYIDYQYSPEPDKPDPVIIIPGILGSWNFGTGWQLDPILNTYDNLWSALELAGYENNVDLFAFPYNWRLPNIYNAGLLKEKINEVKNICQCDKVDVIGHSMGGLVARAYVEMGDYEDDIDQLIFLGVPHRGAPKSYLMWEGGETGPTAKDKLQQRIFKLEAELNGYGSVFDYVRKLPMESVKELLPVYSYLKDQNIYGQWQTRNYPNSYPQNLFLELLNAPSQLAKLNDIDLTNVMADNGASSTLSFLRTVGGDFVDGQWEHGYPEGFSAFFGDHGLEYGSGDGSVPSYSSKGWANFHDTVISSSHNALVTDAQKLVIGELTGQEPAEEIRKNIFSKYLLIRIFSPADFVIISPNGQRLGKDFASGGILNEIEGAFYTGFETGVEFALIPDPVAGEYHIELEGTSNGAYRLSTSLISDESAQDSDYNGLISLGEKDDYSLFVNLQEISDLNPDIYNLDQLLEEIESMYQRGWLNHFGSKNALLSQLKNGFKNDQQWDQVNRFLDNMREKDRLNQRAYDIIKSALININHN